MMCEVTFYFKSGGFQESQLNMSAEKFIDELDDGSYSDFIALVDVHNVHVLYSYDDIRRIEIEDI